MTDVRSHERHEEDFNEVRTCSTIGIAQGLSHAYQEGFN